MAKCKFCKKKLTLVQSSIKCRCGNSYCRNCLHPENHNCSYNYKNDKKKLEEKLVKVDHCKVIKI